MQMNSIFSITEGPLGTDCTKVLHMWTLFLTHIVSGDTVRAVKSEDLLYIKHDHRENTPYVTNKQHDVEVCTNI